MGIIFDGYLFIESTDIRDTGILIVLNYLIWNITTKKICVGVVCRIFDVALSSKNIVLNILLLFRLIFMKISTNRLKNLRAENGWSQEQLAEISSISQRTVQRIEKDGNCSPETQMALASALNISPSELLDEYKNEIGSGVLNIGGVIGGVILISLLITIIAWEWDDISVFVNGWLFSFVALTVISLSLLANGFKKTFRVFSVLKWLLKEPSDAKDTQQLLPVLRRLIVYSYSAGFFWCLTEIVEAGYYSLNTQAGNNMVSEVMVSLLSVLYGVMLAEFLFRPLKNRLESLLSPI